MASQAKARQAYHFLLKHAKSNTSFRIEDLMDVTDWKRSTVETYIGKQWRQIVTRRANGEILVLPEIKRLSEDAFLQLATQNRTIFTTYQRVKYREIVTYEFLLPLTREDQLRKALDALFYKDTIRQRLLEIGLEHVNSWLTRNEGETDELYMDRVCELISEKFGGYSISHVSGRYRAAAITSREDAARMLAVDERYIIDETTASVRFIIPIKATRVEEKDFDRINFDEYDLEQTVIEEITLVHSLFFNLFVEAVVRMVQGEDEIWLVEETTRTRSLYAWQKD
jgi:hypothetical protein